MTTYTMYKCVRCGIHGLTSMLQLVEHYESCPQPPAYIPHAISPAYTYTPPVDDEDGEEIIDTA